VIDSIVGSATDNNFQALPKTVDSDDWLQISPEDLNDIILQKQSEFEDYYNKSTKSQQKKRDLHENHQSGKKIEKDKQEKDKSETKNTTEGEGMVPEDNLFDFMVKDMKNFMEKMSGLEGVQLDEEHNQDQEGNTESDEDDEFYGFEDGDFGVADTEMKEVMDQMDKELATTTVGQSFEKVSGDVDENVNLVRNFLASHEAQFGQAGPVTNLLNELQAKKKTNDIIKDL